MMVAVIFARAVQVSRHNVVCVIAMWNGVMSTFFAMLVRSIVSFAFMLWCALSSFTGISVFVYVIAMNVMQMSIMNVAGVVVVLDCLVSAIFAVGMVVFLVGFTAHRFLLGCSFKRVLTSGNYEARKPALQRLPDDPRDSLDRQRAIEYALPKLQTSARSSHHGKQ